MLTTDVNGQPGRLLEEGLVDDNRDPDYLAVVTAAFRPLGTFPCGFRRPERLTGPKPRFQVSVRDELVQLADMVCGAAGDHFDGRDEWYDLIRPRCVGLDELA